MSRLAVSALALILIAVVLAPIPLAEATHQWGHRYMIYGRILDADGDAVQRQPVTITVDTTRQTDPRMTVFTDCQGLYYSYKPDAPNGDPAAGDINMEGGVMHIHRAELSSSAKYTVTTEFGEKRGTVRGDMHRSTVNFQVDEDVPPAEGCAGIDWTNTYVVEGRLQEVDGNQRRDLMTGDGGGLTFEVVATIETAEGTQTANGTTNRFGDFMITFGNITVEDGDMVTAKWEGNTQSGRVNEKYRVTEANIILGSSGTAGKIFLWVLGGLVVAGVAVWGVSKARGAMESARLEKTSTRKRANR